MMALAKGSGRCSYATYSTESSMKRALSVACLLAALVLALEPAEARVVFPEGYACAGRLGGGPELFGVAGFFMGSRQVASRYSNPLDSRTYQGCFRSVEACQFWQARLSLRYPLPPYLNSCTPVRVR
jgi:hypothetical protein